MRSEWKDLDRLIPIHCACCLGGLGSLDAKPDDQPFQRSACRTHGPVGDRTHSSAWSMEVLPQTDGDYLYVGRTATWYFFTAALIDLRADRELSLKYLGGALPYEQPGARFPGKDFPLQADGTEPREEVTFADPSGLGDVTDRPGSPASEHADLHGAGPGSGSFRGDLHEGR